MAGEDGRALAGPGAPDAQSTVDAGARHQGAVRREDDRRHRLPVGAEADAGAQGLEIDDLQHSARGAVDDLPAAGGESRGGHRLGAADRSPRLAGGGVPEPDLLARAARHQGAPVPGEGHRAHRAAVAGESGEQAAGPRVPKAHRAVPAAARQQGGRRGERHGVDRSVVPGELRQRQVALRTPQPHHAVVAGAGQHPAVG